MKPDWATRLQRTFARKYDAGFAKGLMFGKAVGARDERDRIVALLEDLKPSCFCDDCEEYSTRSMEYVGAIQNLIKGENK